MSTTRLTFEFLPVPSRSWTRYWFIFLAFDCFDTPEMLDRIVLVCCVWGLICEAFIMVDAFGSEFFLVSFILRFTLSVLPCVSGLLPPLLCNCSLSFSLSAFLSASIFWLFPRATMRGMCELGLTLLFWSMSRCSSSTCRSCLWNSSRMDSPVFYFLMIWSFICFCSSSESEFLFESWPI